MQRSPESKAGTWGWAGIAVYVCLFDLTQKESLTHAVERYRATPVGRVCALGAVAVTAAHLVGGIIPKRLDPFYRILELGGEFMPKPIDNCYYEPEVL